MKQRLREILSKCPEIKKDLEEGEFIFIEADYYTGTYVEEIDIYNCRVDKRLEERHLRMYCEKSKILTNLNEDGVLEFSSLGFVKIQLDNTKSFNDQTDEVYKEICEFLEAN